MKYLRNLSPEKILLAGVALLFCLAVSTQHLAANEEVTEGERVATVDPMDTDGLDGRLARVLERYYARTFGGPDNWGKLQSVIFEGTLHLPQGSVRFSAYKRKPDLSKVILHRRHGGRIVMAYDGNDAWQASPSVSDGRPTSMEADEAKNFIRDAPIGGHLLYPMMPGKQIKLLGIVKVDERDCLELEVTLPNGQRIRSAIDITEHVERRQITINNVNGKEEHNIYRDFRTIGGVRFPFSSVMESEGEELHRIEMSDIRINAGLFASMFHRSSEGDFAEPEVEADSPSTAFDAEAEIPGTIDTQDSIEIPGTTEIPGASGFGETPFGESAFPDLEF